MTTHLHARLAWHGNGWNGRVCDAPHLNAQCIAHKHIRDSRDDEKEREFAARPCASWMVGSRHARVIRPLTPSVDLSPTIRIHLSFVDFTRYRRSYLHTHAI